MFVRVVIAALLLAPAIAHANLLFGSTVDCSGDLSVNSGSAQPSSVFCAGNLTFSGASLSSDTDFSITATNDLTFNNLSVFAPSLIFKAGGVLTVDALSTFDSANINLSASSVALNGRLLSPRPVLGGSGGSVDRILESGYVGPLAGSPDISLQSGQVTLVPEPGSLLLLLAGVAFLGCVRAAKKASAANPGQSFNGTLCGAR